MSMDEFFEYAAYNQIEPFGDDREDLRAAMVPWMLAGYFSKKGRTPKFEDFILSNSLDDKPKTPKARQSFEKMESTLKALFESTK
jgi:hypothetical protein